MGWWVRNVKKTVLCGSPGVRHSAGRSGKSGGVQRGVIYLWEDEGGKWWVRNIRNDFRVAYLRCSEVREGAVDTAGCKLCNGTRSSGGKQGRE